MRVAANPSRKREDVISEVIAILGDMTRDWDQGFAGGISEETRLVADLGLESIDFVMLIVAIGERFERKGLPFDTLLRRGDKYVGDISIAELVDFLVRVLN